MELLRQILLFVHLLGFAALLGGALVQVTDEYRVVNIVMLLGALTQVLTGLLLVGVVEGQDEPTDYTKTVVKLVVGLVVAVLCWVNRRKDAVPTGLFAAIVLLTAGNAGVAVFW